MRSTCSLLAIALLGHGAGAQEAGPSFGQRVAAAALERTAAKVRYDPAYVSLDYPGGDVPAGTGVCTDVVVRTLRKVGVDLQKAVHEDMRAHFSEYPKNWGAKRPDKNIDHRRVPNLQRYFERRGASLPVTDKAGDYLPGDLVAWDLTGRGLWHIGVVVEDPAATGRPWIVHNIGAGPQLEDRLFEWKVVGHYRLRGAHPPASPAPAAAHRPGR
jgi:uncharacterized protein YijF (DUF1287 family)